MKLTVSLLVLICLSLLLGVQNSSSPADALSAEHTQIKLAADSLDFETLAELSAASSGLRRAYIEYRTALAAELDNRPTEMRAAQSRALALLEELGSNNEFPEIYSLEAAIHLRRMLHSASPEEHQSALELALARGHQLEPENPSVLLMAAMSMRHLGELNGSQAAMADLLIQEAGVQFERRCRNICAASDSTYVWEGLVDSIQPLASLSDAVSLAQVSCSQSAGHAPTVFPS